ncbi:bZIP Maf transcription factor [Cooperia oncophora]
MDPYCKPSPSYTSLSVSPTLLPSPPNSSAQSPLTPDVTDEELQRISVRQLNQRLQAMDPYCKPSPSYTSLSVSPTLLPSPPNSSAQSPLTPDVTDEELQRISVRQLNQRLQGHDRQLVTMMKQKRRTLKNRGYALNCRVRRIQNQLQLEADNIQLRDQTLSDMQARLQYYEPTFMLHDYTYMPATMPMTYQPSANFLNSTATTATSMPSENICSIAQQHEQKMFR